MDRLISGLVVAFALSAAAVGQTNEQAYHNGVEYFFTNASVPSNATTYTRAFGSATSIGGESDDAERSAHPVGVQQNAFKAWSGQASSTPTISQPLGFSLLEFRRGGTFSLADGTTVATTTWSTSLPCNAPWFWIITFTWGTTFTQTSTVAGSRQNFTFSLRGETNQTVANQNYVTGSGNERSLRLAGLSYIEDVPANLAARVAAHQEFSSTYYQVDAISQANRDPSGSSPGSFGFDTASVGTGGTLFRTQGGPFNPGVPPDALSIEHRAYQQLTGNDEQLVSILTTRNLGGRLTADASGSFSLGPAGGRRVNLVADSLLTALALKLPVVLTTGGPYSPLTGNVGISGVARTIPLDLSLVSVPTALRPLVVHHQAVGVRFPSFSVITSADTFWVY